MSRPALVFALLICASQASATLIVQRDDSNVQATCRFGRGEIPDPEPLDLRPTTPGVGWSVSGSYCQATFSLTYSVDLEQGRIEAYAGARSWRFPGENVELQATVYLWLVSDVDGWIEADGSRYFVADTNPHASGPNRFAITAGEPFRIVVAGDTDGFYPDGQLNERWGTFTFVPEPGSAALVAIGLTAGAWSRRRGSARGSRGTWERRRAAA